MTSQHLDTFSEERRIVTLVHSAIAGASIAATLELSSRETLAPLLLFALTGFAIAIPTAIAILILSQVLHLGASQHWPRYSYLLAVADQIACFAGFLALFWHFHWSIGTLFLLASALAFLTLLMAEKRLRGKPIQEGSR